ncbi:MAG: DNA gyrase inhibitor YacG [Rhodovulum sp.]
MSCPICKKPADPAYRPFCSRRCADVDLGKWLGGGYAIPAESSEDVEGAAEELSRNASEPY